MRKVYLLLSTVTFSVLNVNAQVEDVSVIVSPTLGYNWFDSKSTVENGIMYGVQAGFGFGKFLELRGVYERSANLRQRFGQYEDDIRDILNDNSFNFQDRQVNVERIGGEFKANIQVGDLSPYILLGTGVQTISRKFSDNLTYKNQNIYGSGGLGFKVNLGNRVTLNLEGRTIVYNMNPGSLLYNPGGNSDFDQWIDNQRRNRMYNWSATAGLQFYLGGRNENSLSNLDQAYLRRFSSGMSGLKLTLSPVASYISFNSKASYRSTYLLGGQLGIDFTDYVGLKAYYYQATEDENPSFNFDKMGVYGVDFVGKLNVPRGIVPYLTIGGGYINIQDGYEGKNLGTPSIPIYQSTPSTYYAKGGVGLEVPLGRYFDIFGSANLLYTVDNDNTSISDIRNTDQLRQHTMYNLGLRIKLGKNANTSAATDKAFDARYADDRKQYNERIKSLEKELKEAYDNNDVDRVNKIMEEKKNLDQTSRKDSLIRMSPAELESLIDKVIDGVENESTPNIENRLDRLEQLLININQGRTSGVPTNQNVQTYSSTVDGSAYSAVNDRLIMEIKKLNQQLEDQRQSIDNLRAESNKVQQPVVQTPVVVPQSNLVMNPTTGQVGQANVVSGVVINKGIALFLGPNFGDATTLNVGIRSFQGFSNSPILFMPEAYVALGDRNGFGISANGIIPFNIKSMASFSPYAGVGLGINLLGRDFSFNPNFIAGAAYKIGLGSVFADYTVRGAFKNNQLAFGYRFRF